MLTLFFTAHFYWAGFETPPEDTTCANHLQFSAINSFTGDHSSALHLTLCLLHLTCEVLVFKASRAGLTDDTWRWSQTVPDSLGHAGAATNLPVVSYQ